MSTRTRTDIFIEKVETYLKKFFAAKCAEENIPTVALWDRGYSTTLGDATEYPVCIILTPRKTAIDAYTVRMYLIIGIALSGDDPVALDALGNKWTDILEDAVRSDWSLGDACLLVNENFVIETDCVNNIYLMQARLECDIDLGGYVYETEIVETPGGENLQEVRIQDDGTGGNEMPEMRAASDEGNGERQEQTAAL